MSLASFSCCAGRFESQLVANPEDRFFRDVAHLNNVIFNIVMCHKDADIIATSVDPDQTTPDLGLHTCHGSTVLKSK